MHRTYLMTTLAGLLAAAPAPEPRQLAREIFKELIEIDTTESSGSTTAAANAMAARLKAAGFPEADVRVLGPNARKGNLVVRLRGGGARKPLLLLAHLDVVEARRSDWSVDPFRLTERDGYFYGRGTTDDKAMAAIWIASLIRYKQEGFRPERDIVVALTADEENGDSNGVAWLVKNHRGLIDAEFCLNEGGGGQIRAGKHVANEVQASEKVYLSFRLETTDKGGHSSLPHKGNAIYRLAGGLSRLEQFEFPVKLNDVTRAFFERMSVIETGPLAADMKTVSAGPGPAGFEAAARRLSASPYFNALLRTTCVPTRLDAGHADNALPQSAKAVVNCRLLPGESPEEVERALAGVLAGGGITMTRMNPPKLSPPSPLRPEIMEPIRGITAQLWPGVAVVPVMGTGGTDGLYLRNAGIPTYGVSGLFEDVDDVRAHGRDERLGVREFEEGREFLYRLVKALASGR